MDANSFELNVSVPHDPRFPALMRRLIQHAAQYAGFTESQAEAFGRSVEEAVQSQIDPSIAGGDLPIVVRRQAGPLEVLVNGRTLSLD